MSAPYRVIQWSTGNVGVAALRCIIKHPALELAGVWVHSAEKDGRDAGELCGLPRVGVAASTDADALLALDAVVLARDPSGERRIPLADLFRQPGDSPHQEHNLRPGELIVAIEVPVGPEARRSGYVKVRDRASYEFALASAAVALDIGAGIIRNARGSR